MRQMAISPKRSLPHAMPILESVKTRQWVFSWPDWSSTPEMPIAPATSPLDWIVRFQQMIEPGGRSCTG